MDIGEEHAESNVNFVPCLKWVKRGVAKAQPERVQLTKEELVQIIKDTKAKLKVSEEEETGQSTENDEFNFENYDDEDEAALQQLGIHNIAELSTDAETHFVDDDDSDSEKEDEIIKASDNLLLIGRVNGDASVLEIYVHNELEGSLYCHHDLFLPAFPLCLEWLDFEPNQPKGNYCAIGSMNCVIDIWDLDIVNCLEPAYSLGRKASKKKKLKAVGHKDAVLDLSWNPHFHHILASGSVDRTVLLWDLETGCPSKKFTNFQDKVQSVNWHREDGHLLLTGSSDNIAKVCDCRNSEELSWTVDGEVERAIWSSTESSIFYVGTNTGKLHCVDYRKGQVWSVDAHDTEITGLSFSSQCSGLLASTSSDGCLKLWDCNANCEPRQVIEKDLNMGVLHCLEMCPDSAFLFAAGGDNKSHNLSVVNSLKYEPVKHYFESKSLLSPVTEAQVSTAENMES